MACSMHERVRDPWAGLHSEARRGRAHDHNIIVGMANRFVDSIGSTGYGSFGKSTGKLNRSFKIQEFE